MNSMRRRLMVMLALILLFFQLISAIWLWHESREQIGFLVNETLSAKARNDRVEKEIREAIASLLVPSLVMVGFTLLFSFWAITWITRPLNQLQQRLANRSADNLTPLPMYSDMEEMVAVTILPQPAVLPAGQHHSAGAPLHRRRRPRAANAAGRYPPPSGTDGSAVRWPQRRQALIEPYRSADAHRRTAADAVARRTGNGERPLSAAAVAA